MIKNKSAQEIIALIVQSGEIIDGATDNSDYKINNREFKKRDKLYQEIAKDVELAEEIYDHLLEHPCITVKISSSFQCLKLNIYVDRSVSILEKLAQRTDIGVRSFNAEMCLRVWRGEVQ